MNKSHKAARCAFLLLLAPALLAIQKVNSGNQWQATTIEISYPQTAESGQLDQDAELRMKLQQIMWAQEVVQIESLRAYSSKYVFVGIRDEYWGFPNPWIRKKTDLWLINSDFSGLERLTDDGTSYDPEWSLSGGEIAFISKGRLKILDIASREIKTILEAYISTTPDERDNEYKYIENRHPLWSPNGKALAVLARDNAAAWVEAVTKEGNKVCRFARGATNYWWNDKNELMLDYGKFGFDWDGTFSPGSAREDVESQGVRIESDDSKDPVADMLIKKVSKYGVNRIAHYSYSPLKEVIVFVGEFKSRYEYDLQRSDLWLINRDGAGLRRLTNNGLSKDPIWSASGSEIAFVSCRLVKILDIKTGKVRDTDIREDGCRGKDSCRSRWAPNGLALATEITAWNMALSRDEDRVTAVEAKSGNEIMEAASVADFGWSSQNELIIAGFGKLVIDWERLSSTDVKASRANERYLSNLLEKVSRRGVINVREYAASPSENSIVFVGEYEDQWQFVRIQTGRPKTDLWIMNRDGSRLRRLTKDKLSYDPSWSPSGSEIAFVREGSVKVMNIRTGHVRVLPGLKGSRPYTWECDYGEYERPRWAPNGKAISAIVGDGCGGGGMRVAEAKSGISVLYIDECHSYEWGSDSELRVNSGSEILLDWETISSLGNAIIKRRKKN